jgi:AraC-like DNA-binding protein
MIKLTPNLKPPLTPKLIGKNNNADLFMLSDGFVYAASAVSKNKTSRHAGVLLISLDDKPIDVFISSSPNYAAKKLKGTVILLSPGVHRSIGLSTGRFLSVHFDPTHPIYYAMVKSLENEGGRIISSHWFDDIKNELKKCETEINSETVLRLFSRCTKVISATCSIETNCDTRITEALKLLKGLSLFDYQFDHILKSTNLSASRFSHLFTTNTGLSLRSFLQWKKIKESMVLFEQGGSMTDIAHASGFSDSAHFCRTFNSCLGLKPSMFGPGREVNVQIINEAHTIN